MRDAGHRTPDGRKSKNNISPPGGGHNKPQIRARLSILRLTITIFCRTYCPPRTVLNLYRGIYGTGYILFVYNGTTNISETMLTTNKCHISLERSFYSASAHVCCIKIHAEMNELFQAKD